MNNHRPIAIRPSALSTLGDRRFFQFALSYRSNCAFSIQHKTKLATARPSAVLPAMVLAKPRKNAKHQITAKKAAAKPENRRDCSPLMNIQYRSRPFSGFGSSELNSFSGSSSRLRKCSLHSFALGVEDFEFAEERGLRFDLG